MKRAIIVGRSSGALDEYAAAKALCVFDETIIVGKIGEVFPDPVDHWVSFHSNLFWKWEETRADNGLPPAANFWGATYKGKVLYEALSPAGMRRVASQGGSSGYVAIQVALDELGVDRIVLAGMPMTKEAGHYAGASTELEAGQPWGEADKYWATWEGNLDRLRPYVRSMSGRTQQVFGEPTIEWLTA